MGKNRSNTKFLLNAWRARTVVPAFNIPYLPMMEPIVRALRDTESFGLIAVARLEWVKFEAGSLEAVRDEYQRVKDPRFTGLHLDHVPVIDEDNEEVDFEEVIHRAIHAGYGSVMVDGSRLPLDRNIDLHPEDRRNGPCRGHSGRGGARRRAGPRSRPSPLLR